MAKLMFISETGMFHSACCCDYAGHIEWYGFKPKTHGTPVGEGLVDTSDRTKFINHSLTFEVNESTLRQAIKDTAAKYATKTYAVTVCDCVSFSADVARQVGLGVPIVNMTPYGFMEVLALWNKFESKT